MLLLIYNFGGSPNCHFSVERDISSLYSYSYFLFSRFFFYFLSYNKDRLPSRSRLAAFAFLWAFFFPHPTTSLYEETFLVLRRTMEKKSTNPSLEKILISYSEFSRLKSIESEYNKAQKEKEKHYINSDGKCHLNKNNFYLH
jgi:hypothetical protein